MPQRSDFLGRTGNAELVRGISGLLNLSREIDSSAVSIQQYIASELGGNLQESLKPLIGGLECKTTSKGQP
nr:hypothetical protein [Pseudomonas sp. FME51]